LSTGNFERWMQGAQGWGVSLCRGSVQGASVEASSLGALTKVPKANVYVLGGPAFRDLGDRRLGISRDGGRTPKREHLPLWELCMEDSF
jgi:hypothetical protein